MGSNDKIKYGFEHQNKRDANLEFHFDENFKQIASNQNDAYWKIGIVAPDIDELRQSLLSQNIAVGKASQFLDIGYLCHLSDPNGQTIELLQHTFFDANKIKKNQ